MTGRSRNRSDSWPGWFALAFTLAALSGSSPALSQTATGPEAPPAPAPEAATAAPAGESRGSEEATTTVVPAPAATATTQSRWHGSTLLFDQSTTTQTVRLGADYQSYNPTYELWLAFKPRYFLYESATNALSANLWANLYLELTNSDTTTYEREPLLGPTFVWLSYAHTFIEGADAKTVVALGPRAIVPTDKAARGSGQLLGAGGSASLSQYLPLRGSKAASFQTVRLGGAAIYNRPFWRATSPVNNSAQQIRQDVAGRTITSDQLTGSMNVKHSLSITASGDLRLLPRWELSLSYVWLNSWAYAPPDNVSIIIPTGPVSPQGLPDPTTHRVSTWATASVTYEPNDTFSVSLGYYNLAGQLAPDGTRRNPLWSPNARLFLTLTGNLDVISRQVSAR